MRSLPRFARISMVFMLAMLGLIPSASAQLGPPAGPSEELELKIFHLQNERAADAASMLDQLYADEFTSGTKMTVDDRTNSLIFRAPASVLATVEALLLNLDQTDSKRPPVAGSAKDVGGGITGPLTSMAAKLRRNNTPAAIGSPEFQRYEQEAHAVAQAYRQQLATTPKDDARLGQLKAELQGAVHSAFHARQTWQRAQVAEMRKRLDDIEKNITARSQLVNEIIVHRVEDLINPERQWESESGSTDQDAPTTGNKQGSHGDRLDIAGTGDGDSSEVTKPNEDINALGRDVWTKEYVTAMNSARILKRPLLISFAAPWAGPSRKMELDVLRKPVILNLLSQSFVAVKVDVGNPENAKIQKEFEVKAIPTVVVTNHQGSVVVRREGFVDIDQFVALLQSALAKCSDNSAAKRDDGLTLTSDVITIINKQFFELLREEHMLLEDLGPLHPKVQAVQRRIKWMRSVLQSAQSFDDSKLSDSTASSSGNLSNDNSQAITTTTTARTSDSGNDPRRDLLIAENAVSSAKAAVDEAAVDVDAADDILTRVVAAHKTGSVPEKVLRDAQAESKRKAAALNRVRAELQGKERVLALAKEHLEGEINFAELQVQQAKAEFEAVARQEMRARQLLESKSISSSEYEKALAASRQAQISLDRATAKYELFRKALPGQSAPTGNQTPQSQSASERPAEPPKPGDKREQ